MKTHAPACMLCAVCHVCCAVCAVPGCLGLRGPPSVDCSRRTEVPPLVEGGFLEVKLWVSGGLKGRGRQADRQTGIQGDREAGTEKQC